MKNRLIILFVATIFCLSSLGNVGAAAESHQTVDVRIASFAVRFNDVLVNNVVNQYPLLVYNDITYFPMTYRDSRFLGVEAEWSAEGGLSVSRGESGDYFPYDLMLQDPEQTYQAAVIQEPVQINGKWKQPAEYPFLGFRDVAYFPLIWDYAVTEFGWDYSWSPETGLSIRTREYADSEKHTVLTLLNKLATSKSFTFQSEVQIEGKAVQQTSGTFTGSFRGDEFQAFFDLPEALQNETGAELYAWTYEYLLHDPSHIQISISSSYPVSFSGKPLLYDTHFLIVGEARQAVRDVTRSADSSDEEAIYTISFADDSEWKDRNLTVAIDAAASTIKKIVIKDITYPELPYTHTLEFSDIVFR